MEQTRRRVYDDDDSDEDDMPLVRQDVNMETSNGRGNVGIDDDDSDEDDRPLAMANGAQRYVTGNGTSSASASASASASHSQEYDDDDDEDDDIPLAMHAVAQQRAKAAAANGKKRSRSSGSAAVKREKDTNGSVRKRSKTNGVSPRIKAKKEEDDTKPSRKFEKPGQRRETPADNDPARLFYESMYHEKVKLGKRSAVAETWMVRNGLLDDEAAVRLIKSLGIAK